LGNAIGFRTGDDAFPKAMAEQMPPVVHAHRVD
jgi:hypothetical protein